MTPRQLHEDVLIGSRIVAELGADAIKTFYTEDFRAVTASCPVPVFGLGAEKLPTQRDALLLAQREVEDGASGVVFGRNAIQVPDPMEVPGRFVRRGEKRQKGGRRLPRRATGVTRAQEDKDHHELEVIEAARRHPGLNARILRAAGSRIAAEARKLASNEGASRLGGHRRRAVFAERRSAARTSRRSWPVSTPTAATRSWSSA